MTALEYGCGTGLLSFNLQPFLGKIVLADTSEEMLEVLKEKIAASQIKDVEKLLNIFVNLLNPPGYLCVADLEEEDGSFHGEEFSGHKGFSINYLDNFLSEIGFIIIKRKIYDIFLIVAQKIK